MIISLYARADWELTIELQKHATVHLNEVTTDDEAIIVMSESFERKIPTTLGQIPLFCYQWDCYDWRGNPPGWIHLMKMATEVWTPSEETTEKTKKRYGIDSRVIRIFTPSVTDYKGEVTRGDYVMQGARNSPEIRWDWLERACRELSIPMMRGDPHLYSREEYLKRLANCRAVISTRDEASTGGLTLFEGAMFDKPLLAADCASTIEYLGIDCLYFKKDDYDDFKRMLKLVYDAPLHRHDRVREYTVEKMASEILARVEANLNEN